MQQVTHAVETLADLIIRPQRADYRTDELVGGSTGKFAVRGGKRCVRLDFSLPNARGHTLEASLFAPDVGEGGLAGMPCIVYGHGNCGCRLDAGDVVRLMLPHDVCVACLDFAGSGLSGGDFITLGALEPQDLKVIITFLRW